MGWRNIAGDYLTFSRKERIGIITVIALIFFIWLSPLVLRNLQSPRITADTAWAALASKLKPKGTQMKNEEVPDENNNSLAFEKTVEPERRKPELFYFDPNKITADEWKKLGIREKTIHTILNYLNKGGHFYKPADLQKIYGLKREECDMLVPYVKIEDANRDQRIQKPHPDLEKIRPAPASASRTIDINSADTTAFISLPGIGSKLSARIVSFRDKLGGFYSIDQVGETYGLADTTFQRLKKYLALADASVKKFNINSATKDEMKSHPYFKWTLANAIVEYRNQHGNFSSLEELRKISLITDELFNKIKPYLSL